MKEEVKQRNEAMQWLLSTYPKAFKLTDRVPLKLNIMDDICLAHPSWTEKKEALEEALEYYTQWGSYLSATKEGVVRIDLEGHAKGMVTREEEYAAQKVLSAAQNKLMKVAKKT